MFSFNFYTTHTTHTFETHNEEKILLIASRNETHFLWHLKRSAINSSLWLMTDKIVYILRLLCVQSLRSVECTGWHPSRFASRNAEAKPSCESSIILMEPDMHIMAFQHFNAFYILYTESHSTLRNVAIVASLLTEKWFQHIADDTQESERRGLHISIKFAVNSFLREQHNNKNVIKFSCKKKCY